MIHIGDVKTGYIARSFQYKNWPPGVTKGHWFSTEWQPWLSFLDSWKCNTM